VADRLTSQAEGLSEQQNWPAAANEWKKAAEQFGLLNDLPQQAVALHNQGQAELEQAHHEAALPLFERASDLNRKAGRSTEWWRNQIGILQAEAALTDRSEDLARRFEELSAKAKDLKDPLLEGFFLNELGLWQRRQNHAEQANTTFQQAEQKFTQAGNDTGVAVAISNRALLAEDKEKFAMAETLWRNALGKFEKLADPPGIARALAGLGRSLLKQNKNLAEAEDFLRHAAENFAVLKNEPESKAAQAALAECLKLEGKTPPPSTEESKKP
jgi:tetratricopeptide (TPR) repeat protein